LYRSIYPDPIDLLRKLPSLTVGYQTEHQAQADPQFVDTTVHFGEWRGHLAAATR